MYISPVPLIAVRTDTEALICVNGQMLGECSEERCVSMPIAENGDYYIFASPLGGGGTPMTRRVHVENGAPAGEPPDGISLFQWPGGVLEILLCTQSDTRESVPICSALAEAQYRQYTLSLCSAEELQLYAERDGQPFCRYILGQYESGEFVPYGEQLGLLLHGRQARLLLFDANLQVLLDLRGSAVFLEDTPVCIEELPTLLRHERRTRYAWRASSFQSEKSELGFFTREKPFPSDTQTLAVAFFEALREGFSDEVLSYLSPALREDLSFPAIRDFFGEFSEVRLPFSERSGRLVGLCEKTAARRCAVRLYRLSFENGLISNIAEEE